MIGVLAATGLAHGTAVGGEVQSTLTVSAAVIATSQIDAQTSSSSSGSRSNNRSCATVVVRCTAASPVRVTLEAASGAARQATRACGGPSAGAAPVQSCLPALPAGQAFTISVEY